LGGIGCHDAVAEIGLLSGLPATRGEEAQDHANKE
jgi:hypothetical protein